MCVLMVKLQNRAAQAHLSATCKVFSAGFRALGDKHSFPALWQSCSSLASKKVQHSMSAPYGQHITYALGGQQL